MKKWGQVLNCETQKEIEPESNLFLGFTIQDLTPVYSIQDLTPFYF